MIPVKMTLTFTGCHKSKNLCNHSFVDLYEITLTFAMVDYPRGTVSENVCCMANMDSLSIHSFWFIVCLLVGCLMSQQYASVSQGRICSDSFNFT